MLLRPSEMPDAEPPATLHGVMQAALAHGLRERFRPVRDVPHDLLVLLMQINEDRRRQAKAGSRNNSSTKNALRTRDQVQA
jgi:hypothetical protein